MQSPNLRDTLKKIALLKKKSNSKFKKVKIAFLKNYTIEKIVPYIEYFFLKEGLRPEFYFSNYDNVFQEILGKDSNFYKFAPDVTILAINNSYTDGEKLTYNFVETLQKNLESEIKRLIDQSENIISTLSKKNIGTVLVHNFETPKFPSLGILDYQSEKFQINSFRKLNLKLSEICKNYKNTYIIDIDFLQRFFGSEKVNDYRYWHIEKNPYSQIFLQHIAKDYLKFVKAISGKVKKCIVLDMDNTLYGGVLGEDGLGGIQIGKNFPGSAFTNFQKSILNLYNRGVILGISTKNNLEDVMEVLEKHPDMILRKKHFAIIKANWEDKASNIKHISNELNIGLDSIVFVDDNPFERNLVRAKLPQVKTVELSKDPIFYSDDIEGLGDFDNLIHSFEDKNRTKMYQAEIKRKEFKVKFNNIDDYLTTLKMKLEIKKNDKFSSPRIAQLCQRVNQFNLTSKRYTEGEIKSFIKNKNTDVYSLRLIDKFGDMGIIGAAIIKYEKDKAVIDTLLLSCRSLGRGIENAFLRLCLDAIKKRRCKLVSSSYAKTKKNQQVEEFYEKRGFKVQKNKNKLEKKYIFNIAKDSLANKPKYFSILSS